MKYSRIHFGTNSKENTQELKGKKSRQQTSTSNNLTNQAKRNIIIIGTKNPTPITNLRCYQLSTHQITLLTKGLNVIPTPRKNHPAKILQDMLLFDRKIRLKCHFYYNLDQSNWDTSFDNDSTGPPHNTILYPSSGWTPRVDKIHSCIHTETPIINEFLKELDQPTIKSREKNLTNKEYQAMRDLYNNPDITIKPMDKGGSIVIMNTENYTVEANRQHLSRTHYKTRDEDPTISYNKYIHHLHGEWKS